MTHKRRHGLIKGKRGTLDVNLKTDVSRQDSACSSSSGMRAAGTAARLGQRGGLLQRGCAGLASRRGAASSARGLASSAATSDLVYMHGSLRSPPRWDRMTSAESNQFHPSVTGSALRFEEGRLRRVAEFGTTKQWKTLSLDEAMEQYMLSPRDLAGLPYVSRYHVFDTPRLTRFYVVFDVQDRALERWGSAAALRDALDRRRASSRR